MNDNFLFCFMNILNSNVADAYIYLLNLFTIAIKYYDGSSYDNDLNKVNIYVGMTLSRFVLSKCFILHTSYCLSDKHCNNSRNNRTKVNFFLSFILSIRFNKSTRVSISIYLYLFILLFFFLFDGYIERFYHPLVVINPLAHPHPRRKDNNNSHSQLSSTPSPPFILHPYPHLPSIQSPQKVQFTSYPKNPPPAYTHTHTFLHLFAAATRARSRGP